MQVIINGIDGALGTILAGVIEKTDDMEVVAGITPTGAPGTFLTPDAYQGPADMVIDFSHHDGTVALMDYCVSRGLPAVVCTTGQTEEEMDPASLHLPGLTDWILLLQNDGLLYRRGHDGRFLPGLSF